MKLQKHDIMEHVGEAREKNKTGGILTSNASTPSPMTRYKNKAFLRKTSIFQSEASSSCVSVPVLGCQPLCDCVRLHFRPSLVHMERYRFSEASLTAL